jgi:FtsP/CotA-like multicopper oxidase with cupredoxin domain
MRTRSSTAKRLLRLIAGISAMTLCAATSVFAVPPNTEFLPTFNVETLTPTSQAALAWRNVAPNALASYYTYLPLSTADAALAGFPAALNCGVGTGHAGSDCYIITVKQLVQPMSLDFLNLPGLSGVSGANAFPGPGLISADGVTPLVDQTSAAALLNSAGLTTAWGYGSGGNAWKPYGASGPTIRGNAPAAFADTPIGLTTGEGAAVTGIWHFPAPTIKGIADPAGLSNRPVAVLWMNQLPNVKPVGHDPSVDCGDTANFCYPYNRIVTHVHGAHVGPESDGLAVAWYTPNFALFGEGRFTGSASYDSYAHVLGAGSTGLVPTALRGAPIYYYPMTQEAGTIWYHDHAVGTTHLNTDMGMAGFFPVTDAVEVALQTPSGSPSLPVLPTGTGSKYELGFALQDRHFDVNGQMVMPAAGVYDKNDPNCVFDANNNALPGTCTRLGWMKQLGNPVLTSGQDPTPAIRLIPFNAQTLATWKTGTAAQQADYARNFPAKPGTDPATNQPYLGGTNNAGVPNSCQVNITNTFEGVAGVDPVSGARVTFTQCAPFPAQSATLEYFGNIPVINGVTYPVYNVEPTVYRMRFIGGTDSRTWIAQLVKQGAQPSMVTCGDGAAPAGCAMFGSSQIIPFFQVGSEQGLLTNMVKRNELDIMGGERIDVLVDFTGLGGTTVTLKNLGDDAPYSGRFDFDGVNPVTGDMLRQPTSVLIPEIMKFRVGTATVPANTPSAKTPAANVALRSAPTFSSTSMTRTIALIEITDQYGRTMPTIDARGYIPPGIRTTEVVQLGATEQWDIVNTTVDAHPMHLHQVAFQAIDRQPIALTPGAVGGNTADPSGFMAGANYTFGAEVAADTSTTARQNSIFTPSQYIPAPGSNPIPVAAYDAGLKDTIQAPPGYVTRVRAYFDILGDYVWHCHILSHEEHDMMRPFRVTNVAALAAPTVAVGAVVNGVVTVTVTPIQTAPNQSVVQYRKVGAPFWLTSDQKVNAFGAINVNLAPAGIGTYEFRAQNIQPAIQNIHALTAADSAWVAGNQTATYVITLTTPPTLVSPTVTTSLTSPVYVWSAVPGAIYYQLFISLNGGVTQTNTSVSAATTCVGSTCSFTPATVLALNDNIYWAVSAANDTSQTAWSTPSTFIISSVAIPAAPVLSSPSGLSIATPANYTWPSDVTATGYDMFTDINGVQTFASSVAAVCTTTCTLSTGALAPASNVYWIVRAKNSAGASAWSAPLTFVTQ